LKEITNRAGSAQVQGQGWFLFGGFTSPVTKAQQLKNPDGQWMFGPSLFNNESVNGLCVVQVNIEFKSKF
jgi:hypothetical protein